MGPESIKDLPQRAGHGGPQGHRASSATAEPPRMLGQAGPAGQGQSPEGTLHEEDCVWSCTERGAQGPEWLWGWMTPRHTNLEDRTPAQPGSPRASLGQGQREVGVCLRARPVAAGLVPTPPPPAVQRPGPTGRLLQD